MKVYLDTVGCRLNQSEIETLAGQFRAVGHEIVPDAQAADLAVINTCAVTRAAASDSRALVRRVAHAGVRRIIPTGCWATIQPEQAAGLPNVAEVVSNDQKNNLVSRVLDLPPLNFEHEPMTRHPLPGLHRRTRAFIKVQDGCDNRCTFCVTTLARGPAISRSVPHVLADVLSALRGGAQEIVLTGVHLGSWGYDFGSHLYDLVQLVLRDTTVPRLRLSSLEPWDLDEKFFSLWDDSRLMPHLHLPLQSGCRATLKRMARKTTPDGYRNLVSAARRKISDISITTDIIVGFPGETDAEFAEGLEFIREMNFSGGHVFSYSPGPGTAAARMGEQVNPTEIKNRSRLMRRVLDASGKEFRRGFAGRLVPVLWESTATFSESGWQLSGYSPNYLRVSAYAQKPRWNEVDLVKLDGINEMGLHGVILNSG